VPRAGGEHHIVTGGRVDVLGVRIDNLGFDEAVEAILERAARRSPAIVVTPNVDHVMMHRRDPALREVYRRAALVLADGAPLVWAARLLGSPLAAKVSGSDLLPRLCAAAAERRLRVYLLGGRPGSAERCAEVLRARHPTLVVAGVACPPFGFERDPDHNRRIVDAVRAAAPDLLFVALGSPKQELWIADHFEALGVPVAIGVGAAVDFVSGAARRAPVWMQRAGLEWLFRLLREPRRMWKRYLVRDLPFPFLVAAQRLGVRRR